LIAKHLQETGSKQSKEILDHWEQFSGLFWKVQPHPPAAKPSEAKPAASSETVISEKVIATTP
jgi:glutamate synthase domain-containing protein 3